MQGEGVLQAVIESQENNEAISARGSGRENNLSPRGPSMPLGHIRILQTGLVIRISRRRLMSL